MHFICSSPSWHLSGVNTFMGHLFSALRKEGNECSIVLTETCGDPHPMPPPASVPIDILPVTRWAAVRRRQQWLRNRLIVQTPCTYFPNYDFNHMPVIEVLPSDVRVIPIIHSDDETYYSAVSRYGHSANAIVAVSKTIEATLRLRHPEWAKKIVRIPYGIPIPNATTTRLPKSDSAPLRVVYAGRLSQSQKRIFDLVAIILECLRSKLSIQFTLAGLGPEESEVRQRLLPALQAGTANLTGLLSTPEMNALFNDSDVVILTSEYEGLPLTLLEAMVRNCVPVVTKIASGIDEVIREGDNGRLVAVGDIQGFVRALAGFAQTRRTLSTMAYRAAASIRNGPYNIRTTARAYLALIDGLNPNAVDVQRRSGLPQRPIHYSLAYRLRKRLQILTSRN